MVVCSEDGRVNVCVSGYHGNGHFDSGWADVDGSELRNAKAVAKFELLAEDVRYRRRMDMNERRVVFSEISGLKCPNKNVSSGVIRLKIK